jgi:hypothetical protein
MDGVTTVASPPHQFQYLDVFENTLRSSLHGLYEYFRANSDEGLMTGAPGQLGRICLIMDWVTFCLKEQNRGTLKSEQLKARRENARSPITAHSNLAQGFAVLVSVVLDDCRFEARVTNRVSAKDAARRLADLFGLTNKKKVTALEKWV